MSVSEITTLKVSYIRNKIFFYRIRLTSTERTWFIFVVIMVSKPNVKVAAVNNGFFPERIDVH